MNRFVVVDFHSVEVDRNLILGRGFGKRNGSGFFVSELFNRDLIFWAYFINLVLCLI